MTVVPLRVFSTTAEVAIIEFSANTTVSSVREFSLIINTGNVTKTSYAARKSSEARGFQLHRMNKELIVKASFPRHVVARSLLKNFVSDLKLTQIHYLSFIE